MPDLSSQRGSVIMSIDESSEVFYNLQKSLLFFSTALFSNAIHIIFLLLHTYLIAFDSSLTDSPAPER